MPANKKVWVVVRTQFEAIHSWPEAPGAVSFLRNDHRHMFKVEVQIQVGHSNRELEYFTVKKELDGHIEDYLKGTTSTLSCEHMADTLLEFCLGRYGKWREMKVSVFEDGENGSIVEWI